EDAVERLEQLRRAGILNGEILEAIFICFKCKSPALQPQYQCLTCSSNRLLRYEVVEHFECGYLAPKTEFSSSKKGLTCPQCQQPLKGEGQDYKSGYAFQCLDCNTVAANPRLVFRCIHCQSVGPVTDMPQRPMYVYRVNLEHRGDIIHYLGYHPTPEAERPSRRKHRIDIDKTDRRILNILQRDGRLSFRNVARRLKVSDATVRSRVARLEQNDVIKGFSAQVDLQQVGMEVIGLVHLEADRKVQSKLIEALNALNEVKLVMETGERQNLIMLVAFPTREALNEFLDHHIRGKSGIQLLTVSLALGLLKDDWMVHL
ncbi:MAG: AsnC family transcriptional regulator, partial [Candidatus Hermodarchaeota archaeon]|nr:AsnC family transcriptional regulator [Candidatus Hermodarchaeota archaeon]